MKFNLSIFYFLGHVSGAIANISLLNPSHKSFLLFFFSRTFILLDFTFRFMIHFVLNAVYGSRYGLKLPFFFLICHINFRVSLVNFYKICLLRLWLALFWNYSSILTISSVPNYKHGIFFHLFKYSLIFLHSFCRFQSMCLYFFCQTCS